MFSVAFLSLIVLNVVGGYFYFWYRAVLIKQEMRLAIQTLPDEKLETLTLTVEEFQKSRIDDHEVKVDGKMYDVARITTDGEWVKIFCVQDKAEDNLLSFLDSFLNRMQNDQNPPGVISSFSLLQFLHVEFNFQVSIHPVYSIAETPYQSNYYFIDRSVYSPPPRA